MEVDWGGNIEPNHTPSGCMLIQVDWRGKLRVNHTNECMLSEFMKPIKMDAASLKMIGEVIIQVFTYWMDAYSLKLTGEVVILQVSTLWMDACFLKLIGSP